jgi:hypothetical protein
MGHLAFFSTALAVLAVCTRAQDPLASALQSVVFFSNGTVSSHDTFTYSGAWSQRVTKVSSQARKPHNVSFIRLFACSFTIRRQIFVFALSPMLCRLGACPGIPCMYLEAENVTCAQCSWGIGGSCPYLFQVNSSTPEPCNPGTPQPGHDLPGADYKQVRA